jgi:mono/diheme cytochrome c family protein
MLTGDGAVAAILQVRAGAWQNCDSLDTAYFLKNLGASGMRRFPLTVVLAVAAFIFVAFNVQAQDQGGSPEARKVKNPVASTAPSVTAGAAVFKKYCAFCHNADAKGNGPLAPKGTMPPDLTDAKWDRGSTDGEIFAVIMAGAGPKFEMKGLKGKLPDQDAWHVVNYLRSLGPQTAAR